MAKLTFINSDDVLQRIDLDDILKMEIVWHERDWDYKEKCIQFDLDGYDEYVFTRPDYGHKIEELYNTIKGMLEDEPGLSVVAMQLAG